MDDLKKKYEKLKEELLRLGKVLVAFSGGVDSTFLLETASRLLGEKCLAITVDSPLMKREAIKYSRTYTKQRGIRHEIINWNALSCDSIVFNQPDRCYYCKREVFSRISQISKDFGYPHVIEGTNKDDENDYRPGLKAIRELNVLSPLLHCNLSKEDIRELSRREGIPGWSRPAESCLATRFPLGASISYERLKQVEMAESYLNSLGYHEVRVRHHGEVARIELPEWQMEDFLETVRREGVYDRLMEFGFSYVAMDLRGYRRGSMNIVLGNE
ncbi:MAG: ATP-dependent sacrificial sulfur transferase LarE [Syntrophales bacterium]|nr:ATP-dependent sacrificial sulfur transferase LarE [Syntrophales bacterium]